MAKYYGEIGYGVPTETAPGVWKNVWVKRNYYGDVLNNTRNLREQAKVNDDIMVSNRISVIADPYANNNFQYIKYATFMGAKWKVTTVDVQFPRLILTLGGVFNGQN